MQHARRFAASRAFIALAFVLAAAAACTSGSDLATHQHDLEERLLAPCCWRESLAVHDSPIATTLRTEIRERLTRGESPASIESDLVDRHGEKIRALPEGRDPRWLIGVTAGSAALLALVALGWFVRRRAPEAMPLASQNVFEGEYADRLDDELLAADE
jgi:cytochrome c-type biogenesis protein CcmH